MEDKPKFDILYLEDAVDFLASLPEKISDKIVYNISKSRYHIDKRLFEKLTDTVWEFRTIWGGNCYRLLAFWDNETESFVVATHGFMKKTQKTPPQEIAITDRIRKQYFEDKKKSKRK